MPFKFAWLVELLQALEQARAKEALPSARTTNPDHQVITQWFSKYDHKIIRQGKSGVALLSCLFPERCPERSYNVQEKRLSQIFGRALGLGWRRAQELNRWREKDGNDFASCVEAIMAECEFDVPVTDREVTLEEIDTALTQIAANSPFSSPKLRLKANEQGIHDILDPILHRLQSYEAKWLVRLLLKSFSPVQIPERLTLRLCHFLLPDLLDVQNSIEAAVIFLSKPEIIGFPPSPSKDLANALRGYIAKDLTPQFGIMVKRQPFEKARSIKHCCDIAGKRLMSIERKYDGEYCQIHIDLSKGRNCIQVFSKSGKDSTQDRIRLHGAIRDGLKLDTDGCKIRRNCIIEGELLVWKSSTSSIEPFYKIRRHVMHGRRFLGTEADSQPALDESLMIIFFDVLLLDGKSFINEPHTKRRQHLKAIVTRISGVSDVCERDLINFGSRHAADQLRVAFSKSITQKWEGFVLKGCEDPYLSWNRGTQSIKLKKDYITGLGDSADLCIVGGRRDPKVEQELQLGSLKWTTFYLACIDNKEDVRRFDSKPRFSIIDTIGHHCISKDDIMELNNRAQFSRIAFSPTCDDLEVKLLNNSLPKPTDLFRDSFIVEVYGAGFDRPQNCSFFVLRFPRTKSIKLHFDRTVVDTTTLEELQAMAKSCMSAPADSDSQEDARWIKRLLSADPKNQYVIDKSQSTSPGKTPRSATTASISPVSLRKPAPPVFVRADTEDLGTPSTPERGSYVQSSGVTQVPSSPYPQTTLKRKSYDPANATDATMPNKRSKRSPMRPEQLEQVDETARLGGRRQSSPTTTRTPLAELSNLSPQMLRRPLPRARREENPEQLTKEAEIFQKGHKSVISIHDEDQSNIQQQPQAQHVPPTLPKSSVETKNLSRTGEPDKKLSTSPQHNDRQHSIKSLKNFLLPSSSLPEPLGNISEAKAVNLGNPTHFTGATGPILLAQSLSPIGTPGGVLTELMRRTNASFTYSAKHFMNEVVRLQTSTHIVLVDMQDSEAVAQEYLKFKHDPPPGPSQLRTQLCSKIVFLDYRFLYDCLNRELDLKRGKKHFSGYINVGAGFVDARDVNWDWKTLVNKT